MVKGPLRFLRPTGRTTDGAVTVAGVYRIEETLGLPLSVLVEALATARLVPSWDDYRDEAEHAGIPRERVHARVSEALADVYPAGQWKPAFDAWACRVKEGR